MRVGNEGFVSPVGDLLAFGLSICIVLGLGSTLAGDVQREQGKDALTGHELEVLRDWRGWDEDGDSILEEVRLEKMRSGDHPDCYPGIDGDILVRISWGEKRFTVRFRDGTVLPMLNDTEHPVIFHGLPVSVMTDEGTVPGCLEGGRV